LGLWTAFDVLQQLFAQQESLDFSEQVAADCLVSPACKPIASVASVKPRMNFFIMIILLWLECHLSNNSDLGVNPSFKNNAHIKSALAK
jgi:hypothetical protein